MIGKKAQVSLLLKIISAFIIIVLIMWFYFAKVAPGAEEEISLDACRITIKTASAIRERTSALPPVKINCPAPEHEFDILKEGEEVIERRIATELHNCWYKTAGDQNRLGKSHWVLDIASRDPNVCIVCSTFTVTNGQIITSNVEDYIKEKNLFASRWPGRYFIEILSTTGSRYWSDPSGKITPSPDNWYNMGHLSQLKESKTYYVIDLHAPVVSDDYVHVFVIDEDELDELRCDVYYHEISKK